MRRADLVPGTDYAVGGDRIRSRMMLVAAGGYAQDRYSYRSTTKRKDDGKLALLVRPADHKNWDALLAIPAAELEDAWAPKPEDRKALPVAVVWETASLTTIRWDWATELQQNAVYARNKELAAERAAAAKVAMQNATAAMTELAESKGLTVTAWTTDGIQVRDGKVTMTYAQLTELLNRIEG